MEIAIEIHEFSGFCHGVVNAIAKAEEELKSKGNLYSLGDIVHNNKEMQRLEDMGLKVISHEDFKKLKDCTVLIRAHGEPPSTYNIAKANNITLIDATCPVVLKLQKRVKQNYLENPKGQVIIYGKQGHAEVVGLVGQTDDNAKVVSSADDIKNIDFSIPTSVFSQTTKSPEGFLNLMNEVKKCATANTGNNEHIVGFDTTCKSVNRRQEKIKECAQRNEVVVFVSGRKSSNGKMLYELCKGENENTYFISEKEELLPDWFKGKASVGICGATSTPRWLMEEVGEAIKKL